MEPVVFVRSGPVATALASEESEVTTLVAGPAPAKPVVAGLEVVVARSVAAGSLAMYGSEKYIQLPVISAVIIVVLESSLVCRRSSVCGSEYDAGVDESTGLEDVEETGPETKRPKIETISRLSEPQVVFFPPINDCKFKATGA